MPRAAPASEFQISGADAGKLVLSNSSMRFRERLSEDVELVDTISVSHVDKVRWSCLADALIH